MKAACWSYHPRCPPAKTFTFVKLTICILSQHTQACCKRLSWLMKLTNLYWWWTSFFLRSGGVAILSFQAHCYKLSSLAFVFAFFSYPVKIKLRNFIGNHISNFHKDTFIFLPDIKRWQFSFVSRIYFILICVTQFPFCWLKDEPSIKFVAIDLLCNNCEVWELKTINSMLTFN